LWLSLLPQILTFVKVFHWLVQDRVDYMETTPATSRLQHLRIISFMGVLLVCSSWPCSNPAIVASAFLLVSSMRLP